MYMYLSFKIESFKSNNIPSSWVPFHEFGSDLSDPLVGRLATVLNLPPGIIGGPAPGPGPVGFLSAEEKQFSHM